MGRFLTVFLVLLLLLVTEIGPTVGWSYCETVSKNFKGYCFFSSSCAKVCYGEGGNFDGGHCGLWNCMCYHRC
ncbi:hypothetical protein ACJIZ3_013648 [Penstemon smallii]|uniref:Knottins-like domain-containing protein n=1 Tax=Penstemon smallii TaxID=265156 RepID=A0ABD3RHH5_9LAMI